MQTSSEKLKHADLAERFTKKGKLHHVEYWAEGRHHVVFKAESREHGVVAVRAPKAAILKCPISNPVSAKEVVQQEYDIYSLLWRTPVFVPRPLAVLNAKSGYSALVCELVASDAEPVTASELGRVLRALHDLKVPFGLSRLLVAHKGGDDALDVLVKRIDRHYADLLRESPEAGLMLPRPKILKLLASKIRARNLPACLLHMDIRNENLMQRMGITAAMTDWAHAMVGPAVIEVYRVLELLSLEAEFLAVYTEDQPLPELSREEELFLRLDGALERALRFLVDTPDPVRCSRAVIRVREIIWDMLASANDGPPEKGQFERRWSGGLSRKSGRGVVSVRSK